MNLTKFIYVDKKKSNNIYVKKVSLFSFGLMFKKSDIPLLFSLKKEQKIIFTSIFCKPFTIFFLDKNKKVIKKETISSWKWKIPGYAKYILEVPKSYDEIPTEKQKHLNIKTTTKSH